MLVLLAANALAGDVRVGLEVGPDRYASSLVTSDWTSSTDTKDRKCWSRGPGTVCLAVTPSNGQSPQAALDAEKAKYSVQTCDPIPQPPNAAAATAQCRVLDGLQAQARYWSVIIDGPQAVWVTVSFTGDDVAVSNEASTFVGKFSYNSPLLLTTMGTPMCAALHAGLVAGVDRFATVKGAPLTGAGHYATTLAWPGAPTNELVEHDGTVSYHATVDIVDFPDDAIRKTQTLLNDLAKCDSWCAPMAQAETNLPNRRTLTLTPTLTSDSPPLACATTGMRVEVVAMPMNTYFIELWFDAK